MELHKPTAAHASLCPRIGIDENIALDFSLMLEELFTNIVSHGYKDAEAHETEVVARKQCDQLSVDLVILGTESTGVTRRGQSKVATKTYVAQREAGVTVSRATDIPKRIADLDD